MNTSNETGYFNQLPLNASSSNYYSVGGNDTVLPSPPPSSEVISTTPAESMRQSAFLWLGLVALYYMFGPRRSHIIVDQNVVQDRLRRLRAEEVAKEGRVTPERRREKINQQIMSGIITKFDTAKFRLAGMKKKPLQLPVQESYNEDDSSKKNSKPKAKCNSTSRTQCTECNLDAKIKPQSGNYEGIDGTQTHQENNNTSVECSICLEVLEPGEKLSWSRNLICQHVFHHECLMSWLMTHDECPYCRTQMICDDFTIQANVEDTIYADIPTDNLSTNSDEGSPVDVTLYSKLRSLFRQSISYYEPQRVTRIHDENNGSGTLNEFAVDVV